MINSILLIDDNNIDNYINRAVLNKLNIAENIIVKTSTIDALAFLNSLKEGLKFPQIIFLDIRMPLMDGFGFLKEFEKFPLNKRENYSVYILSSSTNDDDINTAKSFSSVKKYLNKPLQVDVVKNLI
jgi:CheY-like chemotaxis protein